MIYLLDREENLRGPRGTGFIYLRKDMQNFIKPNIVDNHNIIDKDMSLRENHIFENFEYFPTKNWFIRIN